MDSRGGGFQQIAQRTKHGASGGGGDVFGGGALVDGGLAVRGVEDVQAAVADVVPHAVAVWLDCFGDVIGAAGRVRGAVRKDRYSQVRIVSTRRDVLSLWRAGMPDKQNRAKRKEEDSPRRFPAPWGASSGECGAASDVKGLAEIGV